MSVGCTNLVLHSFVHLIESQISINKPFTELTGQNGQNSQRDNVADKNPLWPTGDLLY